MSEVSDLLQKSLALHIRTKARGGRTPDTRSLWANALFLRMKAHELDPHHCDPAWEAEQSRSPAGRDTHAELILFYKSQGIRPQESPVEEPVSCEVPPDEPPKDPPKDDPPPHDPPDHPPHPRELVAPEPQKIAGTYEPDVRQPEPKPLNLEGEYELTVRSLTKKPRKPRAKKAK